jgi:transposase
MNESMAGVRTLAIDLAKTVFQIAGENDRFEVVYEARLTSRKAFYDFLRTLLAPLVVLMETGPGAQAWARLLRERGIDARILPAQRVQEHRSGAKNDRKDCLAILRAGRDASIHPVPVKSPEVLAMQAIHRVRSGYLQRRTAISNQMRGLLTEQGVVFGRGDAALSRGIDRVLEDATQPIPDVLRALLADLWAEHGQLSQRIDVLEGELQRMMRQDPLAGRLSTIPGIGPISSTALACKELDPNAFANARQFAAYFGVVPDQHSSGNRIRTTGMSKRGDGYIRSLLINGAHAVLQRVTAESEGPDHGRLRAWKQRLGTKAAAVRLANRNLRIVYALMKTRGSYGIHTHG